MHLALELTSKVLPLCHRWSD